jgi:acetoin utilization deacetylase AcuC-like enzyme/GNAT superfamily N-acetyltransferase
VFRIRRIHDDVLPVNRAAMKQVVELFGQRFDAIAREEIEGLGPRLRDPFKKRFRSVLYVAENSRGTVLGFAIVLHEPKLRFSFLDFIAAGQRLRGRGVGAALYEHVREEAAGLQSHALLLECLPDDPGACADPAISRENAARLRFYEQYGARPIVGTKYELPVPGGSTDCLPHLVYDDLDRDEPLPRKLARAAVRAILERKYADLCPPAYVTEVVRSFRHNPVQIRAPRYPKRRHATAKVGARVPPPIAVAVNDRHDIHHVRERGYVEAPIRIAAIAPKVIDGVLGVSLPVKKYPISAVLAVHDKDLVDYLRKACAATPPGRSVYPYVFPIRNATRQPRELAVRAGYYCIDTFTPINANALPAALRAVDCALSVSDAVLGGTRVGYALVRPPGHHAERRSFGGFCYFNSVAVAAHHLSRHGTVAIVDLDYHHGNGQQDIFYRRADVLTVSIHGDPDFAYPYFTGFADEQGEDEGRGYNLNLPQPEALDGAGYRQALRRAIARVVEFAPDFLVIALGLDPAKGDPTGTWTLQAADFRANGEAMGGLGLPTVVVQEGGYRTRTLGANARSFLSGLAEANDRA